MIVPVAHQRKMSNCLLTSGRRFGTSLRHMKRKRSPSRKSIVTNSRWAAYVTASAASALASAHCVEGAITYSGLINRTFNAPLGGVSYASFQLDQPAAHFSLVQFHRANGNGGAFLYIFGYSSAGVAGFTASGYHYASKLTFGQALSARPNFVAPRASMADSSGRGNSQWLSAGTGFLGFRFDVGNGQQYGWARITMNGAPGNTFTLVDYAFGDVGDSVTAGQVPEPGSLGLLALGGLGLLAWRKKRAKATGGQPAA